jgi:hypothetical protein
MATTTVTDAVTAVAEAVELEDTSLAQESTKTLLTATVSTVAVIAGAVVLAKAYEKVTEFRVTRAAKKAEEKVHVVTDMPETENVN